MLTAYAASAANDIAGGTTLEIARLVELIISKIPLWIAAFIVIVLAVIFAKIARNIVENKLAESGLDEEHKEVQILGGRITYFILLTLGITVGLKIAGIDMTTILAAVAFGVGFALKDMIMNFLAGVMILTSRHFTLGDFISVGGTIGKVVEIQSRVTVLQAIDGTKVVVPNADLFKKQVTSFTSNPFRRIEVAVGVEYRSNLENVLKICMHVLHTTKGVLREPKPAVFVGEFGDSSINLKLRAWVDSRGGWVKVKSDLIKNVKSEFDKYGVTIPWPINTLVDDANMKYNEKMFEEKEVEQPKTQTSEQAPFQTVTVPVTIAEDEGDEQPLKPLGEQR